MVRRCIALIEAEPYIRCELQRILELAAFEVLLFSADNLDQALMSNARLFVVGNDRTNPAHIASILRRLGRARPTDPTFILAQVSSEQLAITALKEGAADYFPPPIKCEEVAANVCRLLAARSDRVTAEFGSDTDTSRHNRAIIGNSPSIREIRGYLPKVAQRECNTLVLGETGTGKDLIAEAIHSYSPRRTKPFVCVNCAAIPDTLLESELFGYEKGAFTGADGAGEGKIRQAHGGTLFLDEIGDMSAYAQAKILRVIESKQIQRLGGKAAIPVNIRIVAATNQDLPRLISEQRFRKDLYFRLNVVQIQLPPLRQRRDDVLPLLEYYLGIFNRLTGSTVEGFTRQALDRLRDYDWPGNIRELRSVVESIFIDPPYAHIDECHLPWLRTNLSQECGGAEERDQLLEALEITQWNKSKAAERLRWSRMKIYRKLAQYKIEDRHDRPAAAHAG